MRLNLGLGVAVACLVPAAFGFETNGDAVCTGKALAYLACRRNIPWGCIDDVASQASSFCSSYLSITATTFATATEVTTATVTETETSETIVVETSTTTTETTSTEITATTSVIPGSTVTATSLVPPTIIQVTVKRRLATQTACPDLSTKRLTRHPASKLSSVCSCLGITATTAVSTATATAQSTAHARLRSVRIHGDWTMSAARQIRSGYGGSG
ncbi:hypothetical protein OQA88_7458 [Cercophora sp. LCS_1]